MIITWITSHNISHAFKSSQLILTLPKIFTGGFIFTCIFQVELSVFRIHYYETNILWASAPNCFPLKLFMLCQKFLLYGSCDDYQNFSGSVYPIFGRNLMSRQLFIVKKIGKHSAEQRWYLIRTKKEKNEQHLVMQKILI